MLHSRMGAGLVFPVLALAVLFGPATALGQSAANKAKLNALVKEAEGHYAAGRYKQSAETMIEAYIYGPHPRLIYNIGRAYDQANELDLALEYYQRYVSSPEGTDPTLLKRAALSIDRLRGLMAQRDETKKREAEEQARLSAEAQAQRERAEQEALAKQRAEEQLRAQEAAAIEERGRVRARNRTLAFVAGGVAVAGLGTGTAFGLSANGAKGQFRDAQTVAEKQTLQSTTRTRALIADAGFVVGAAAAVTAVLLYPKGADEPEVRTQTEVVASASRPSFLIFPTLNGAGVEVRF